MEHVRRTLTVATAVVMSLMVSGVAALAQATPETVVSGGAEDVKDSLLAIAGTVLPYAAVVLAITLGWRFAKRFVRG
ncbi:MAG: hypothetical protein IT198_16640 [Acidimicrobiia bacterium]|nr:hypothetical protein [Acidimicrobiia bacterium]